MARRYQQRMSGAGGTAAAWSGVFLAGLRRNVFLNFSPLPVTNDRNNGLGFDFADYELYMESKHEVMGFLLN